MAFTPVTIFPRNVPGFIAGDTKFTFDASLEDTFQAEIHYTQFPLEVGALATDHGIILPRKWYLTAAMSNNPLKTTSMGRVEDNTNLFLSNLAAKSHISGTVARFVSGFLGNSGTTKVSSTRAGDTLNNLITMMVARIPFDVDAVDIQLTNMVIQRLFRTRKPEIENGLLFTAELMELPTVATALSNQHPGQGQLRAGSAEQTQATAKVYRGEVAPKELSASDIAKVKALFPGAK